MVWPIVETEPFQDNWHIGAICEHYEALIRGQIRNLIVMLPPRHMKSLLISVMGPAWAWTVNPSLRILLASYAHNLAIRDAVKSRRIIQSDIFKRIINADTPDFQMVGDQNTKVRYDNNYGGYRIATSVGGQLTGEGGDIIGCLPADTLISTLNGFMEIGKIVTERKQIPVLTYEHVYERAEFGKIENWFDNGEKEIIEFETENRIILRCSHEHPIYTFHGYKRAGGLSTADVCFVEGQLEQPVKIKRITRLGSQRVYNLKTTNRNFFANSILVHNCDDAHNVVEGESSNARQAAVEWWNEAMSTRLSNPKTGRKVVIGQRVHCNDLIGAILDGPSADEYTVLCLPAEYELNDHRTKTILTFTDPRKEEGEFLWSKRWGKDEIATLKSSLGSYASAAQLQQRPFPRSGGMFDVDKIHEVEMPLGNIVKKIRYWDKAGTEGGGAATAGVLLAKIENNPAYDWIILDVVRGHWAASKRNLIIEEVAKGDGINTKLVVEQEPGSGGKESAEYTIRSLVGYTVKADKVTGSKDSRAEPYASQIEIGKVAVLKAAWTKVFLDEHRSYPVGKFKDQVDAAAGAFNSMFEKPKPKAGTWGR